MLPLPTKGEVGRILSQPGGEEVYAKILVEREKRIAQAEEDPFERGFVLPWWLEADKYLDEKELLIIFGGNGSAKTWYGAWHGVRLLAEVPGIQVLFLHQNDTSSVIVQQKWVYRFLPTQWKAQSHIKGSLLGYDPKNGFKNNRFVTPGGSTAVFGNYNQDVGSYEGTAWKLVVADEDLPLAWLSTLLYRLPRAQGKMIWTFTPIYGLTKAIKHVVDNAKTVKSARADQLPAAHRVPGVTDIPAGHMPVEQEPIDERAYIRYVFTNENPFEDVERVKRLLARKSSEEVERRFYGYSRGSKGSLFPMFGGHNIIDLDKVPEDVTRYHIADPHGTRPVFMIWVAVDEQGRHYVYREWPDFERFGEWAVESPNPRKFDGDPGPAAQPNGYGVEKYKATILHEEGKRFVNGKWNKKGEKIFRRYGDPRAIKNQVIAEDSGGTSFCERMVEVQRDKDGSVVGPCLDFLGAPGLQVDVGVQAINDLLSWNPEEPMCSPINEPKLYVTKNCRNLIYCLSNWSNRDGEKSATKDPIDDLRYMATAKLFYVDPETWVASGGGTY